MVEATISFLDRGQIRADLNFVLEGHTMGTTADWNPDTEIVETPIYNLVIDHPEGTILWDTGSHPKAGDGHWPPHLYAAFDHFDADERDLQTALGEAGYDISDIDYVFQTHLHLDHAGGLHHFAGTDVPVFVHEEELKYAYYSATTDQGGSAYVRADFDHDLNWEIIHRERVTHFEDIEFLHLPGHTPGLMGTRIDLDGFGTALFASDVAYMRENYDNEHPLGPGLLWSRRHWQESLGWLKELERRHNAVVFCGHDPADAKRLASGLP